MAKKSYKEKLKPYVKVVVAGFSTMVVQCDESRTALVSFE